VVVLPVPVAPAKMMLARPRPVHRQRRHDDVAARPVGQAEVDARLRRRDRAPLRLKQRADEEVQFLRVAELKGLRLHHAVALHVHLVGAVDHDLRDLGVEQQVPDGLDGRMVEEVHRTLPAPRRVPGFPVAGKACALPRDVLSPPRRAAARTDWPAAGRPRPFTA